MKKLIAALAFMSPALALAHQGPLDSVFNSVLAGVLHPVTGIDHLLAIAFVGFLAGQMKSTRSAAMGMPMPMSMLVGFVFTMLLGFVIAQLGITLPWVESMILLSVAVGVGGILLHKLIKPSATLLAMMGFGIFHGFAHGAEVGVTQSSVMFATGFLTTSFILACVCQKVSRNISLKFSAVRID